MSKLKRKKPKVKMRSYGDGEKVPVVKSGGDFYLADQKYDNLGHGEFSGQTTGKLEGPSKRAIKGKGKKSANVRVTNEGGDPIFLKDTSPMKMKNDYSSMKSMGQAIAKWTSPMKLISPLHGGIETEEASTGMSKQDRERIEKEAKEIKADKEKAAAEKKIADKAKEIKKTKNKEKATDITQGIGRAMAAYGGTTVATPSKSAQEKGQEKRDKEKKDKDKKEVDLDASAEDLKKGVVG